MSAGSFVAGLIKERDALCVKVKARIAESQVWLTCVEGGCNIPVLRHLQAR